MLGFLLVNNLGRLREFVLVIYLRPKSGFLLCYFLAMLPRFDLLVSLLCYLLPRFNPPLVLSCLNFEGRILGAAGANGLARPPKIDVKTLCLLYMVLFMALWMSSLRWPSPAGAGVGPRRYGPAVEALVTCLFFTFVTVLLQALLAIALSEKPAPTALPPPVSQWMMGISVWMSGVLFYLIYASMARGHAAESSHSELIIAGAASVVSLAMTVYNMLQRPVFA